jgi:hypothetical protein
VAAWLGYCELGYCELGYCALGYCGLGGLFLDDDELLGDLLRLGGLVLDGDDEAVF